MWNLPEHNLPSREKKYIGMSSILAWGKSRVGLTPPFIARITKQPHGSHKWPQWPRSTDWSEADDDITTCNFALKCLIPKLLRVTVLLRYYAITARYFTHLSYWHQSYRKSKYFILIMLLRQGTSPFFLIGIKATVKASVLFLLRYSITARYSTLLFGIKATVNASFFILITLLRYYGKVLHSSFFLASKDFDFLLMDLFVSADQDGSRLCLYLSFHFVYWTCFISYNFIWYGNLKASATWLWLSLTQRHLLSRTTKN